jgi:hypothetical protein
LVGSVIATFLVIVALAVVESTVGLHEALGRTGLPDMLVAAVTIGGIFSWALTRFFQGRKADTVVDLRTHLGYAKFCYVMLAFMLLLTFLVWPATDLRAAYIVVFLFTLFALIVVNGLTLLLYRYMSVVQK